MNAFGPGRSVGRMFSRYVRVGRLLHISTYAQTATSAVCASFPFNSDDDDDDTRFPSFLLLLLGVWIKNKRPSCRHSRRLLVVFPSPTRAHATAVAAAAKSRLRVFFSLSIFSRALFRSPVYIHTASATGTFSLSLNFLR